MGSRMGSLRLDLDRKAGLFFLLVLFFLLIFFHIFGFALFLLTCFFLLIFLFVFFLSHNGLL